MTLTTATIFFLLSAVIFVVALLSAVFSNDIVCLAVTPVLIDACRTRRIAPIPFLLGLACAANIGSAATLIGNPQNMLIGQTLRLSFAGYFAQAALPVGFGLLLTWAWLMSAVTLLLSNLVSNVPAVMLLLPMAHQRNLGPLLALVSTFSGNLLVVGSIANIIVLDAAARPRHQNWLVGSRTNGDSIGAVDFSNRCSLRGYSLSCDSYKVQHYFPPTPNSHKFCKTYR